MKKYFIFCFLTCLFYTANAQEDLRFGFQMSPSFSWMGSTAYHVTTSGTNLGLKLGLLGEYYFREEYAFAGGIGFHFNAGGTITHENVGFYWRDTDVPSSILNDSLAFNAGTKFKYSIQYLEIPFGLKMRTREFGYVRYYFQPEITMGFKTQARGTISGVGIDDGNEKYDIRKEVNGVNLSWGLGGGIEYTISEGTNLIAGIAYQRGFADVTDDKRGQYYDSRDENLLKSEDTKAVLSSITIRLGIMF